MVVVSLLVIHPSVCPLWIQHNLWSPFLKGFPRRISSRLGGWSGWKISWLNDLSLLFSRYRPSRMGKFLKPCFSIVLILLPPKYRYLRLFNPSHIFPLMVLSLLNSILTVEHIAFLMNDPGLISDILLFWRCIWEAKGGISSGMAVRLPYPAQYPSAGQSASESATLDQCTTITAAGIQSKELICKRTGFHKRVCFSGGSRISPRRGRQLPGGGGRQHTILAKTAWNWKNLGPGERVPGAPLRSATVFTRNVF